MKDREQQVDFEAWQKTVDDRVYCMLWNVTITQQILLH